MTQTIRWCNHKILFLIYKNVISRKRYIQENVDAKHQIRRLEIGYKLNKRPNGPVSLTWVLIWVHTCGLKSVICKSREKLTTKYPKDYQLPVCQPIKGKGGHIGFLIHMKINSTWPGPCKVHLCHVLSRSLQSILRRSWKCVSQSEVIVAILDFSPHEK